VVIFLGPLSPVLGEWHGAEETGGIWGELQQEMCESRICGEIFEWFENLNRRFIVTQKPKEAEGASDYL